MHVDQLGVNHVSNGSSGLLPRRRLRGLARLVRSQAAGAATAQIWQALTTFLLQAVAAWVLGARGLGTFSLCLGIIVLATAGVSGMVGDSLVVLDRHDPTVRGGLLGWAALLSVLGMTGGALTLAMTQVLTPLQATVFGLALGAFVCESLLRRLFMAILQFWRLVLIDSVGLLVTLVVLLGKATVSSINLVSFFLALLVGQTVAIVVGLLLLPPAERRAVPPAVPGLTAVAHFGLWRGAQVSIPPLVLTLVRVLVIAVVGRAALGHLEAARLFAAPLLLVVQGFGSYLLSTYVRDRALGLDVLARRARRTAFWMTGGSVVLAGVLAALTGLVLPMLGRDLQVSPIAVLGWGVYVAGTASCQPFASLAATQGRQIRVFWCRCTDAVAALALLYVLLEVADVESVWTPFVLAGGLFGGGALVRWFALGSAQPDPEPAAAELASGTRPTVVEI